MSHQMPSGAQREGKDFSSDVSSTALLIQRQINNVQTRCSVKGEAHKNPLFWRFFGDFLVFSGAHVCSLGIPQENL